MKKYSINMCYGLENQKSERESAKISTACHQLKNFLQDQGAWRVGYEFLGKDASIDVFVLNSDGPTVMLKSGIVYAKNDLFPKSLFREPVSLEVSVAGGEEVHPVVKSVIKIAPFLQPDYRELKGDLNRLYAEFDSRYRNKNQA